MKIIQTFLFETDFYEQIRHKLSFIYKKTPTGLGFFQPCTWGQARASRLTGSLDCSPPPPVFSSSSTKCSVMQLRTAEGRETSSSQFV